MLGMALLTVGSCKKESRNNAVTWSSNPHLAIVSDFVRVKTFLQNKRSFKTRFVSFKTFSKHKKSQPSPIV